MHTPPTREQADAYAQQALALMAQEGLAPHPDNFALWYAYVSGERPELKGAIDAVMAAPSALKEQESAAAFQQFMASSSGNLSLQCRAERIVAQLEVVIPVLQRAVRSARDYNETLVGAYSDTLVGAARECVRNESSERFFVMLAQLLRESRAMARQAREAETQINEALAHVNRLKDELAGARKEALTDALTGIANRKMFEVAMREDALASVEEGEPLSLLLMDIDHFKRFNDTYGHAVGDHVLKLLAVTLRECVKGLDTAARYGGEEFAVLLPRTALKDAAKLAENIRLRVAGKTIVNRKSGEQLGRVTVSVGAVQFEAGEPLRRFVERADEALYLAKRLGRNRVAAQTHSHEHLHVG